MTGFKADRSRVIRDLENLAALVSKTEPGYTRLSFSEEDRLARSHLAGLMEKEAGLEVRIDAAGNLIGRGPGSMPGPALALGSHLDTVRGGGRFDGVAGIVAGLEALRLFRQEGLITRHPLELIVFLAEEPSAFGLSTIGSRAMAGRLTKKHLEGCQDEKGWTLAEGIRVMGGSPEDINKARRTPNDLLAYLELHIEQGPELDRQGVPLGLVTGIVGIHRGRIEVMGRNDHAGTTPMSLRKDALTAAAEIVLALEDVCRRRKDLVGTVGRLEVYPNAANVVPGQVKMILELRGLNEVVIGEALASLESLLERIEVGRGVKIDFEHQVSSNPVVFNPRMLNLLRQVCRESGHGYLELPSGAGHDASHLAEVVPTGLIFVPSREGRSHCPEEWTEYGHICLGAEILVRAIKALDEEEPI
ncbi:MAG: M20 family metallo-hydrolase [Thermodesulfobacteriota bacterium]